MGDIPGPSSAPYFLHGKAGENFARLCQFIMTICSDVLRDVFSRYVKPADLRKKLDSERPTIEKNLNPQQKTELYPQTPTAASITTKNFDISLLYILLRNICGITACDRPDHKKKGWGKTPPPGDYCLCACIQIIREMRNSVTGHLNTGAVDDKDFHIYWNQLKEAVLAIEREITGADMYERGIDELYTCDLNPTTSSKYITEFAEAIILKRERMDNFESKSRRTKEKLDNQGLQIKRLRRDKILNKQKLDKQGMQIKKLQREMALYKQQASKQGEQLMKSISEQVSKQGEQIMKTMSEQFLKQEERFGKLMSDHKIFCKFHPSEVCFMFCKPCQVSVCAKCIIEKHQLHVLDELIKNGIVHMKMKMSGAVTQLKEFQTPFNFRRISCVTSDKAWFGDWNKLALLNVHGDVPKEEKKRLKHPDMYGNDFIVTSNGNLLVIDGACINRITQDDGIRTIINTDMQPTCIYSSLLNNDILVGIGGYSLGFHRNTDSLKVVRYNVTGEKLTEIIVSDHYDNPHFYVIEYVTENRYNGDICSVVYGSDKSLKVLGKLGENHFTYTGRGESKIFGSVATDILGHILLPMYDPNRYNYHVDMLDHDGNFLSTLLRTVHSFLVQPTICIDNLHRLWYGDGSRVQIYRYLEEEK